MKSFSTSRRPDSGAVLPTFALMLIFVVGCLALAIDLGHVFLVKGELQRAADAGAQAAALGLFNIPARTKFPVAATPDCPRATAICQTIVSANQADSANLQMPAADIAFGRWEAGAFTGSGCSSLQQVTAVRVVVRKDETANGKVPLFFAGLVSSRWHSIPLMAQAIALTGFAGYALPGSGVFPLAVDANKVPPAHGGETIIIHLNPTPGDAGCWHTYDDKSPGSSDLRGIIDGTTPTPPLKVGDEIRVKEGVSDSVLTELANQFSRQPGGTWTVLVPVISGDSHTGWLAILGFVAFKVTYVDAHGTDKRLEGYTVPNYVAPGVAPGGPNYGLWAGVPKLVQ